MVIIGWTIKDTLCAILSKSVHPKKESKVAFRSRERDHGRSLHEEHQAHVEGMKARVAARRDTVNSRLAELEDESAVLAELHGHLHGQPHTHSVH